MLMTTKNLQEICVICGQTDDKSVYLELGKYRFFLTVNDLSEITKHYLWVLCDITHFQE